MTRSQKLYQSAGLVFPAAAVAVLLALSPLMDPYLAYVATSWVIFGTLGLSLDVVWGKGGFLSLAQTAFYGLGGYAAGVATINLAPMTGDTIVWALPVGILTGALVAGALGWIVFYARMGALQSTILSYTFTLVLWSLTQSFKAKVGGAVIGGDNGMSNVPGVVLDFGANAQASDPSISFAVVVVIAAAAYFVTRRLMRGTFGQVIDCIRLDLQKTELLGYDVRRYQLLNVMVSGGLAGLAGAMFGAWSNYLNPSMFSVQEALLAPIYVLVGGLGTLAGPFVGALVVGGLSFWLGGGAVGGQTTLVLGVVLILLVLFLRNGVVGSLGELWRKYLPDANDAARDAGMVAIDSEVLENILLEAAVRAGPAKNLSTANAFKEFGGVIPVNKITLAFEPGRPFSLIGPNGAGKSSYLKLCAGIYSPDGGAIQIDERDVTRAPIFQRVHLGMAVKNQKPQIFGELTVIDNLWIAANSRLRDAAKANEIAAQILSMLGLVQQSKVQASALSHGQQQWLDIGMVLSLAPRIILLDEPAAGMTNEETRELSKLVKILAKHTTVVVVEHDMEFVRTLEGHVTVLHRGEVFAEGSIDTLRTDDRVLDIYLGRRAHV